MHRVCGKWQLADLRVVTELNSCRCGGQSWGRQVVGTLCVCARMLGQGAGTEGTVPLDSAPHQCCARNRGAERGGSSAWLQWGHQILGRVGGEFECKGQCSDSTHSSLQGRVHQHWTRLPLSSSSSQQLFSFFLSISSVSLS